MTGASADLARSITRAASRQTDLVIGLLVDRRLVDDAYRAYAYFRWVDDRLDQVAPADGERRAFLDSQRRLIQEAFCGRARAAVPQEQMLVDLLAGEGGRLRGVELYVHSLLEVMAFDVERRGRLVSEEELAAYTRWLAVGVTEALHAFIGRGRRTPRGPARYQAVTGAHLAHMLRDLPEDLTLGYVNIPREELGGRPLGQLAFDDPALRRWVRARASQARRALQGGRDSLRDIESLRCRIAALAYTLRFEAVLRDLERASFVLRPGLGAGRPGEVWATFARALLAAATRLPTAGARTAPEVRSTATPARPSPS